MDSFAKFLRYTLLAMAITVIAYPYVKQYNGTFGTILWMSIYVLASQVSAIIRMAHDILENILEDRKNYLKSVNDHKH